MVIIEYYTYLRSLASTVLSKYVESEGKVDAKLFSQGTMNKFLESLEKEKKIVLANGKRKVARIGFKWIGGDMKDIQVIGLKESDPLIKYRGSKNIWMFLAQKEIVKPQIISLQLVAALFNAKSIDEFEKLTPKERTRLINEVNPTLVRSDWKFWENAASNETELRLKIKIYKDGLLETDNSLHLINRLANTLWDAGNLDEAKEYMLLGVNAYPQAADMHSNLGLYYHQIAKEYDKAEKHYQKAYELCPKHYNNTMHYAWFLHGAKQDYYRAEILYRVALKVNSTNVVLHNYGLFLCFTKFDFKNGVKYLKKALANYPNDSYSLATLANAYTTYGQKFDEAEELYRRALAIEPISPYKQTYFAQLLFILGREDEAMACIEVAKRHVNDNQGLMLEIEFYLYAHCKKNRRAAQANIEKLLAKGVIDEDKNFTVTIQAAIKQGHPSREELIRYARAISKLKYDKNGNALDVCLRKFAPTFATRL